jgi:transcriptional regulator with XRE-family HTH domain
MEQRNRLAQARRTAGLTQHQLAEVAGCSRATVARIELAEVTPTHATALVLAHALDVSPTHVFPEVFAAPAAQHTNDTDPAGAAVV